MILQMKLWFWIILSYSLYFPCLLISSFSYCTSPFLQLSTQILSRLFIVLALESCCRFICYYVVIYVLRLNVCYAEFTNQHFSPSSTYGDNTFVVLVWAQMICGFQVWIVPFELEKFHICLLRAFLVVV